MGCGGGNERGHGATDSAARTRPCGLAAAHRVDTMTDDRRSRKLHPPAKTIERREDKGATEPPSPKSSPCGGDSIGGVYWMAAAACTGGAGGWMNRAHAVQRREGKPSEIARASLLQSACGAWPSLEARAAPANVSDSNPTPSRVRFLCGGGIQGRSYINRTRVISNQLNPPTTATNRDAAADWAWACGDVCGDQKRTLFRQSLKAIERTSQRAQNTKRWVRVVGRFERSSFHVM